MKYCCDVLRKVTEEWDRPFYVPVYVDKETLALRGDSVGVQLFNLTKSDAISSKGKTTIWISYCPFCGTRLRDETG